MSKIQMYRIEGRIANKRYSNLQRKVEDDVQKKSEEAFLALFFQKCDLYLVDFYFFFHFCTALSIIDGFVFYVLSSRFKLLNLAFEGF